MKNEKYSYDDIRVSDQRPDKGARARKGLDYYHRYLDAAIDYIRRNPTAPLTALDEEDLKNFREEQERGRVFGTGPEGGIPSMDTFKHAKMVRARDKHAREMKMSDTELKLKTIFDVLFTPPNARKK